VWQPIIRTNFQLIDILSGEHGVSVATYLIQSYNICEYSANQIQSEVRFLIKWKNNQISNTNHKNPEEENQGERGSSDRQLMIFTK
jgi:hypothetical protein